MTMLKREGDHRELGDNARVKREGDHRELGDNAKEGRGSQGTG